jgi:hypothetical protein
MKAICFHCHFVAVNYDQPECPQCSYPLIKSAGSVRLATSQITEAFSMADMRPSAPVLPGIIQKEVRAPKRAVPAAPETMAKGSVSTKLPTAPTTVAVPKVVPAVAVATAAVANAEQMPRVGRRLLLIGEIMSGILLAGLVITLLGLWTG